LSLVINLVRMAPVVDVRRQDQLHRCKQLLTVVHRLNGRPITYTLVNSPPSELLRYHSSFPGIYHGPPPLSAARQPASAPLYEPQCCPPSASAPFFVLQWYSPSASAPFCVGAVRRQCDARSLTEAGKAYLFYPTPRFLRTITHCPWLCWWTARRSQWFGRSLVHRPFLRSLALSTVCAVHRHCPLCSSVPRALHAQSAG